MTIPRIIPAALLLAAAPAAAAPPADVATEAALRRHIAVLASDGYGGRKPGTPGAEKTVRYIAAQFRRAGLKPGAKGGGWYQPVALVNRAPGPITAAVHGASAAGTVLAPGAIALVAPGAAIAIAGAPVIFAGYGVSDDAHTTLGAIDARGAVLLVTPGPPNGTAPVSGGDRRRLFAAAGAVAAITVFDKPEPVRALSEGSDALASETPVPLIRGAITPAGADAIFAAAGAGDAAAAVRAAFAPGFKPIKLKATLDASGAMHERRYTAANVIGLLPGRGAAGEAIAYTAHWDHLGTCRAAGAPDRICNGAVDNASGVATLIEIARRQAKVGPATRAMLFVATTAEEMGLLGAEAFASDPPRPLPKIVAAMNIDTIAIANAGQPAAIIGRGITPALDRVVDTVAASLGRTVDADTEANSLVQRQDGWALGKRGLPSVMIGGSFSDMGVLERYLGGDYHHPTDDIAHLPPLGGAAEDVALHVAVGRALADPARYPAPGTAGTAPGATD